MDWDKIDEYTRQDLIDEIQGYQSEAEFYETELRLALDLMIKVASGRQTSDEMGRWVSLNYPKRRGELPEHLRELPPERKR
jgi:hypothetical protein